MKTAEATTTQNTATVAEQGAPVAPEKAPSKKGANQKKDVPKGQKRAQETKSPVAAPKKDAKAGKKAAKPTPPRTPASRAPRARARKSWN